MDIRTIKIHDQDIVLDTSRLHFSEGSLSEYLETEGGWIDYFGAKLADAERELAEVQLRLEMVEAAYEKIYNSVFNKIKSAEGKSDKVTEAKAKLDKSVCEAQEKVFSIKTDLIERKYCVKLIYQHLKAWQLNHENAQNRGNTLRKEMNRKDVIFEERLEDLIKEVEP